MKLTEISFFFLKSINILLSQRARHKVLPSLFLLGMRAPGNDEIVVCSGTWDHSEPVCHLFVKLRYDVIWLPSLRGLCFDAHVLSFKFRLHLKTADYSNAKDANIRRAHLRLKDHSCYPATVRRNSCSSEFRRTSTSFRMKRKVALNRRFSNARLLQNASCRLTSCGKESRWRNIFSLVVSFIR